MDELAFKLDRIRSLLDEKGLDALILNRISSFAWATCGASSWVNTATSDGVASLVITHQDQHLATNNIEAPRLANEEQLVGQGWNFLVEPWYESGKAIQDLIGGKKVGADGSFPNANDLSIDVARLRSQLTPDEGERFSSLGRLCAAAMRDAMHSIKPGQAEWQIAALLAGEAEKRGVQPIVILVAADERAFKYRHPIPTDNPLQHYAMVILCGRKWGLVCSMTREVHFGALPDALRTKMVAAARVDAEFILNTRPGSTLGQIFTTAQSAYASTGFPGEWKMHHQGGSAGYEPREFIATPDSQERILPGQVFAWNPSIQGAKSEDTILIGENENRILTQIPDWPAITIDTKGGSLQRPAIWEVK